MWGTKRLICFTVGPAHRSPLSPTRVTGDGTTEPWWQLRGARLGGDLERGQCEREGRTALPLPSAPPRQLLPGERQPGVRGAEETARTPQPPPCYDGPASPGSPRVAPQSIIFLILSSCLPPAFSCVPFSPCLPLPPLRFVAARQPRFPPPALRFDPGKKQLILLIFIVVQTFPALPLIKFLLIFFRKPFFSPNPRRVFIFKCAIKLLDWPRA